MFFDQQRHYFFEQQNYYFGQQKFKLDKNEIPKRKFYSKMRIFLIRLDFPFPKDKKNVLRYPLLTKIKT